MSLQKDYAKKFGPWAVVTGASSGIGLAFATHLAAAGVNVVLVARRRERLEALSKQLIDKHEISTRVVVADLSVAEGAQTVVSETSDLDVGLLVNNAGVEVHGSMLREPVEKHHRMISVNVVAVTTLAHHFAKVFSDKRRGGILFVSSTASHPFPWFATYSATKAYVSNLAYTLRHELWERGVYVTSVEPGATVSEMSDHVKGEIDFAKAGMSFISAEKCALVGLKCLYKRKLRVSPGVSNAIMMGVIRVLPLRLSIGMMGNMLKKAGSPELFTYE